MLLEQEMWSYGNKSAILTNEALLNGCAKRGLPNVDYIKVSCLCDATHIPRLVLFKRTTPDRRSTFIVQPNNTNTKRLCTGVQGAGYTTVVHTDTILQQQ